MNRLIVGVTGMAGSGKSIVVEAAVANGYDVVSMGDEVREEAKKRCMEPTPENLGTVMLELRQAEGESVIARRCIPKIERTAKQKILVDGVRSLAETEEFKKHYPDFSLIAVHASPETRFTRIYNRQRSDDPKDWLIFQKKDQRELNVGLGNAIAMAQHIIVNEGNPQTAKEEATEVLRKVEAKWTK